MALLKVSNLCLGYENRKVVENLNFEVLPGDYLCIVGENGISALSEKTGPGKPP